MFLKLMEEQKQYQKELKKSFKKKLFAFILMNMNCQNI